MFKRRNLFIIPKKLIKIKFFFFFNHISYILLNIVNKYQKNVSIQGVPIVSLIKCMNKKC